MLQANDMPVLKASASANNMLQTQFYVCPVCGNIVISQGDVRVSCHEIDLLPREPEKTTPERQLNTARCLFPKN